MAVSTLNKLDRDFSAVVIENSTQLEAAATFGKMLLERNEQLEDVIRTYEERFEEQEEEIKRLLEQNTTFQTFYKSRMKIYDFLEVNIYDLEEENKLLVEQYDLEQKHSANLRKSLHATEKRCDDMEKAIEELKTELGRKSPMIQVIEINANTTGNGKRNDNEAIAITIDEFTSDEEEHQKKSKAIKKTAQSIQHQQAENEKLRRRISELLEQQMAMQVQLDDSHQRIDLLETELSDLHKLNTDLQDEAISSQTSFSSSDFTTGCNCSHNTTSLSIYDELADMEPKPNNERATQTSTVEFACKVDEHRIIIQDVGAASPSLPGGSICQRPRFQRLFRGVLCRFARLHNTANSASDAVAERGSTVADGARRADHLAEPRLADGAHTAAVTRSPGKRRATQARKKKWRPIDCEKVANVIPLEFKFNHIVTKSSVRSNAISKTVKQLRNLETKYINVLNK